LIQKFRNPCTHPNKVDILPLKENAESCLPYYANKEAEIAYRNMSSPLDRDFTSTCGETIIVPRIKSPEKIPE
jgi:hypothetical protein